MIWQPKPIDLVLQDIGRKQQKSSLLLRAVEVAVAASVAAAVAVEEVEAAVA